MALFPESLDEIDFWDLDMFSDGDPHMAWSLLRREAPVWFHDRGGSGPFWCITRYEDIHAVRADPLRFACGDGITLNNESAGMPPHLRSMLGTDPPRHTPLRKVVSHNFTPRAISRLEEQLRGVADDHLDEVADRRDVDFVTAVAHPIPAAMALSMLGVPQEDWGRLAELEHLTVHSLLGVEVAAPDIAVIEAMRDLNVYFRAFADERRINPGDDLIGQLVNGVVQGEPLSRAYAAGEAQTSMNGGLDTTRAAASAGAMLPLLERRDELDRLRADPAMLSTAVDEFVRWGSPILHLARMVTAPTVIRDVELHQGDRVVVFPPSANRDDGQFPDPFHYDITRRPNKHLGFGFGEHFCLGVHLARLTLKVVFEQIVTRFKTIELAGEPARVRNNFLGGLERLPVHMVPV